MADRKSESWNVGVKEPKSISTKSLGKEAEFRFYAPNAQRVSVAGTFNNWNQDSFRLKKAKDGFWTGQFKLQPGRYEYRFLADGRWENDPGSASVPNTFGSTNSILEVK